MPITLNGDTGIQTPMYNGTITANAVTPSVNMKNRIINGAMVIDQRNAGASTTPTSSSYFIDRWATQLNVSSKFSVQQLGTTPPSGFINYMRITSLSAYSLAASDVAAIYQAIEGLNTADLDWGTANAKTVTLSFWVRSSLTGAFGGTIQNSGQARSYPYSYTINSANTWEYKTVTITGDTTGTWLTTNGIGINVKFSLGVGSTFTGAANAWTSTLLLQPTGSTSLISTNGATLDITGVQLEVGSTATSFDYRPYGTELALCQRYYQAPVTSGLNFFPGYGAAASYGSSAYSQLPVEMRTTPTGTISTTTSNCTVGIVYYDSRSFHAIPTYTSLGYGFFYISSLFLSAEL